MKKKNQFKTKKLAIISIIAIIIIAVIITYNLVILFCTPLGKAYKTIKYINSDKVESDVIPIGNTSYWYSEYKGEIDSSVIDKSAYYFSTELIPEYYKIKDSKEYYKKHKREIKVLLGIKDYDNFGKLVNKIKTLKGENLKFEKYFIIEESSQNKNNELETVLGIQYEENEVILFTLNISNKTKKKKTPVIYNAELNKEYKVERDDTIIEKGSNPGNRPGKVIN